MALNDLQRLHELRELVEQYGGESRVERLLNVHRTTLYRWLENKTRIPDAALHTLRAAASGQMPYMDREKAWQGWRFARDGMLYSPAGEPFHGGDLLAIKYMRDCIKAQQRAIKELEEKLKIAQDALDRYMPAANDRKAV